jgi:diguanylate cyclase (GGDEF)-like protein
LPEREKQPSSHSDTTSGADDPANVGAGREASAEVNQKTSEFDERRWNRGHAAVDREHAAEQREAAAAERDRSQAEADQRIRARRGAADDRDHAAADRDDRASERDQFQAEVDQRSLNRRGAAVDQRSSDRGHAANDREHAAVDRHDDASDRDQSQAAADDRTVNRMESARDREAAAADRERAIADRLAADHDYGLTRDDLRRAQLDQLTGAFGREMGLFLLEREIVRARHGNGQLVLGYIDVDGLKQINDSQGHAAGDELLSDVAGAIQKNLRAYDTLVRVGGDEFVCALGDCTLAVARDRFEVIRATLERSQPTASISVGYAELRSTDTLEELTKRGDLALYEVKRSR